MRPNALPPRGRRDETAAMARGKAKLAAAIAAAVRLEAARKARMRSR